MCGSNDFQDMESHLENDHCRITPARLLVKFGEKFEELKNISDELYVINYWLVNQAKNNKIPPTNTEKAKYKRIYEGIKDIGISILSSENL